MAYQYYIKRFDSTFQKEPKIRQKEWLDCAEELDLEIQKDAVIGPGGGKPSVAHHALLYCPERGGNREILLLFSEEVGYGITTRVDFDEAIDTLREVGEYLQAFVYGDEGELYYMPGYGDVQGDISIHDIREGIQEPVNDMREVYLKFRKTGY